MFMDTQACYPMYCYIVLSRVVEMWNFTAVAPPGPTTREEREERAASTSPAVCRGSESQRKRVKPAGGAGP